MCSPTPCARPSLSSILVRSERRVDWRRRSSLADSVCDDDADHKLDDNDRTQTSPAHVAHNTNTCINDDEQSKTKMHTAPPTSISASSRTVTFAPTIKQRRIPGLANMDREEIASLWRTPVDRSQCTSHIADTVRVVRSAMRYRDQDIGGGGAYYDETLYCERGIEVYLDEKYKQKLMHKRRLIVVSVLSKQEELRQRHNFDPTKANTKFWHENELANLATTISRDSVKSARIRAKRDLFAARGVNMSNQQQQPSTSSSSPPPPSSSSSTSTTTRFGGMASAARSLSWNRRNALSALKRDNSRRFRERQQFVDQVRRMSIVSDADSSSDSSDSSSRRGSSPSVAAARGRCRAAKMA